MFSYLKPRKGSDPVTLAEYFRETVFHVATPERPEQSFFLRVMKTEYARAEAVARTMMQSGTKVAERMAEAAGQDFSFEEGILLLVDHQRQSLGLQVNKSVFYRAGDADRLWPGLHLAKN